MKHVNLLLSLTLVFTSLVYSQETYTVGNTVNLQQKTGQKVKLHF